MVIGLISIQNKEIITYVKAKLGGRVSYLIGEFEIGKGARIALPISLPFPSRTNLHAENGDTPSLSVCK